MNVIFDLDGTLIDSSERMYCLFQTIVQKSTLTKKDYWELKRNKINHQMLLEKEFPDIDFEEFNRKWFYGIEDIYYLSMDRCYEDTIEVLKKLSSSYRLYLLTARQSERNLLKELERLQLKKYFSEIFVTGRKNSKEDLLKKIIDANPKKFSENDWFVSDMGIDILIGNSLKFYTIAISHGFMTKKKLQEYKPNKCINELSDLLSLLS